MRRRDGSRRHLYRQFAVAHGIHRHLLLVVWIALLLGGLAGVALYAALSEGIAAPPLLCASVSLLLFSWPLSWAATFRVLRPLKELAQVAGDLKEGRLERRAALVSADGEVGVVSSALQSVSERLSKQLQDQKALMATVSHELRSPLARMAVLVDMAREGSAPADLPEALDREVRAMDQLISDLLAAARIDFEAVALRELALSDVLSRSIARAGVRAKLPPRDLGSVLADPTLLVQALSMLLDNANKHGGGEITIEVDRGCRDPLARITVRDAGPGFTEEEREALFRPFARGDAPAGREKPPGTGLGLSLARRIARAMGGEAGAEAGPGGRVWIDVPSVSRPSGGLS